MRRPRGVTALAVVFAILALNALAQVVLRLAGGSDDPAALALLQLAVGASAGAAAFGSWRMRRWAPAGALLYGVVTAAMLASLGRILGLDPEERRGILVGAASVLLFGVWAAWYLRRVRARATTDAPRGPT